MQYTDKQNRYFCKQHQRFLYSIDPHKMRSSYHSNHLRCKVDDRPEVWIDDEEKKPERNAAPDRQVSELDNTKQFTHQPSVINHPLQPRTINTAVLSVSKGCVAVYMSSINLK